MAKIIKTPILTLRRGQSWDARGRNFCCFHGLQRVLGFGTRIPRKFRIVFSTSPLPNRHNAIVILGKSAYNPSGVDYGLPGDSLRGAWRYTPDAFGRWARSRLLKWRRGEVRFHVAIEPVSATPAAARAKSRRKHQTP